MDQHKAAEGIEDTGSEAYLIDEPVASGHRHAEGLEYHEDELPEGRAYLGDRDLAYLAGRTEDATEGMFGIAVDGIDIELVEDVDDAGYDPGTGTVSVWSTDGEQDPDHIISNAALHIADAYDDALEEVVERRIEEVSDRYRQAEDITASARFDDIEDPAQYTSSRERITVDESWSDQLYPASGTVTAELRRSIDHEVAHAIQYQTNDTVTDLSDTVSERTHGHAEYREDVGRAAIEAIATFEEDPGGEFPESDNALPYLFLERSLGHTYDLVSDRADPMAAEDGLVFDDPYDLGRVTAVTVDAAFREEHGEEEGREIARDALLTVTSARGGEGMLGNALEMLGVPDIPEIIEETYDELQQAEDGQRYIEEREDELWTDLEDGADPDRLFIEAEALKEVCRQEPYSLPDQYHDIKQEIEDARDQG